MAGNYVDVPSWRMAFDRDGTVGATINPSLVITQMTGTEMSTINDESNSSAVTAYLGGTKFVFIFPEKRDLDGYFIASTGASGSTIGPIEVSTNSTNGVDGTWTQIQANYTQNDGTQWRTQIRSATALAIKAVRFVVTTGIDVIALRAVHLYGEIAPGENPNRLILWHPTLNQRIGPAYFDWGDVPRSSSADKTFRVKNNSSTLTANSIRVAQEILTDASGGSPSVVGQHTLSTDGTTFVAQVNVGNLAPGAIYSGTVTLRRNTPSNAQLGLFAHRVFAEANSWT